MSEKKQVLYDLRFSYSGPLMVEEFFEDIDKWIHDFGFYKEPKKTLEHLSKEGKKIDYIIEITTHLDDLHHGKIVVRVYMKNLKEATVTRGGKKTKIQNGDVLVNIDGFIDAHLYGTFWQQKPVLYFLRAVVDRFIWPVWGERFDGTVISQCHELHKRIRAFFTLQKYKYE